MVDFGPVIGVLTLVITLIVSFERLLSKVNVTLIMVSKILSQIDSAFAETGGLSEFLTSSVVSTERTTPAPLDKGASGSGHGVSP